MARPREFDRDEALKHATAVFWAKGFGGASTEDLLGAMKIGRQSLYDTFGDKRRLYLEALERYLAASTSARIGLLESQASPLAGIRRMLMAFAAGDGGSRALGCMGVGSISEFGQSDAEVDALNRSSARTFEAALGRALAKAKARREIAAGAGRDGSGAFHPVDHSGIEGERQGGARCRRAAADRRDRHGGAETAVTARCWDGAELPSCEPADAARSRQRVRHKA